MNPESTSRPKRPSNPFAEAGTLSRLFFWWTRPLFKLGLKRPLLEGDIFECLDEHRSAKLTDYFAEVWSTELRRPAPQRPNLIRALFKIYAKKFLLLGVLYNLVDISIKLVQPQCLGGLIVYFSPGDHGLTANDANLYATTIIVGNVLVGIFYHGFLTYCTQIGMRIRLTCTAMIYKKMMRLTKSMSVDGLNGQVINLMANDVARFDLAAAFIDCLWKGPVMLILVTYLIYQEIGWFAFFGIGLLLFSLPVQLWMGRKTAYFRTQTAGQTGKRVRYMNEILQAIQVIKMYTWEKPFATLIDKIRKKELQFARRSLYVRGIILLNEMFATVAIFLSLVTYVYFGNAFTARRAFVVSAYMQLVFKSSMFFWSHAIQLSAEALVSIGRIEEFLLLPESKADAELLAQQQQPTKGPTTEEALMSAHRRKSINKTGSEWGSDIAFLKRRIVQNQLDQNQSARMALRDASAAWMREGGNGSDVGIVNVDLEVEVGKLCAVVGSVGSGKSSLLQVILGELDLDDGSVLVSGVLSYASQEPWLFEGSVRQNILFVEPWNEERYQQVIKVCALERDLELLPFGDETIVGERGSSLSGGQRARVNLARAVYRQADIYLLDDPLSAVDSRVGKHIFEQCVMGFLKNTICVLVTHQLQYLRNTEHLVVMSAGAIMAQGSYNELRSSKNHSLLENMDNEESQPEVEEYFQPNLNGNPIIKAVPSSNQKQDADKEQSAAGMQVFGVLKTYFQFVNNKYFVMFVFVMIVIAPISTTFVSLHIAKWTRWEDSMRSAQPFPTENNTISINIDHQQIADERNRHVLTYVLSMSIVLISALTRSFSFFQMCIMSSRNLHDRMFRAITRSYMSFFNANPSGRILNRFAKDIDTVDTMLPLCLFEGIVYGMDILSSLVVVSMWNSWMLIPTFLLMVVFSFLRHAFVRTARPVKRYEALSRSPIFAHTNATLQGLSTIRAFNAEKVLCDEFGSHLDLNTSASYQYITVSRAFSVWVELTCAAYIAVALVFFLFIGNETSGSQLGLAITQLILMTSVCQWTLRQQSEVENQMVSVQRIVEYTELESEPPLETTDPKRKPTQEWPSKGALHFDSLSMSYTADGSKILKDINVKIEPKEKIGIVGRTGAGKSSIIQALFRLAHNQGSIWIDGIDINQIGLQDLRSRISIIPQEPILFSGSMRHNLDPFAESDDVAIWRALTLVELKDVVAEMPGGLDGKLTDGGSNFSLGQRQLVCLARALLRRNRILVLDEATANVDAETDRLIQTSIRDQFSDCTVLTIAHRLHTVMDSDRVLVMEAGKAVEFGAPSELLDNPTGTLTELVRQTGRETEAALRFLAKQRKSSNKTGESIGPQKPTFSD